MQKSFQRIPPKFPQILHQYQQQTSPAQPLQSIQTTLCTFLKFLEQTKTLKAKAVNFRKFKGILGQGYREIITVDEIRDLMLTNIKKTNGGVVPNRQWTKNDVMILLWVTEKYNVLNKKIQEEYNLNDWARIGAMIPGKNAHLCLFKWLSFFKNPLDKYPWTQQQNSILRNLVVDEQKADWTEISQKLYLSIKQDPIFRSGKQCKQHYAYHLNPKIKKGHWSSEEDLRLIRLHLQQGNRWQKIAAKMDGRTENSVKNRINVIIEKNIMPLLGPQQTLQEKTVQYVRRVSLNLQIPNAPLSSDDVGQNNQQPTVKTDFQAPTVKIQQQDRLHQENDNVSSVEARINDDQYFTYTTVDEQKSVKFVSFVPAMSIEELLSYDNLCSAIYCKQNKAIIYKQIAFGKKYCNSNSTEDRFFQESFVMENIDELDGSSM